MTTDEIEAVNYYRKRIKDCLDRLQRKLKRLTDKCDHEYSDKTIAIRYGRCDICLTNVLYYTDTRYCDHCEKDTVHVCRDSTHERDSYDDYQMCQTCYWFMTGATGEYIKGE